MKKSELFYAVVLCVLSMLFACGSDTDDPSFDIPTLALIAPADSTFLNESQPTFTWNVEGQLDCDFYFGTSPTSLFIEGESISGNEYSIADFILKDSTTYYWKVIAWSKTEGFRESEIRSFTIQ